MLAHRGVMAACSFLVFFGCSAAILQSREIRLNHGDTAILVRESGAVIVDKRQVGTIGEDGRLIDPRGRMLAWIHDNEIRLRGGASVPFARDPDGSVRIPEAAQVQAGLKPVKHRIRPNGTMAQTRNAAGIEVQGASTERNRRIILLVLLLTTNGLWG